MDWWTAIPNWFKASILVVPSLLLGIVIGSGFGGSAQAEADPTTTAVPPTTTSAPTATTVPASTTTTIDAAACAAYYELFGELMLLFIDTANGVQASVNAFVNGDISADSLGNALQVHSADPNEVQTELRRAGPPPPTIAEAVPLINEALDEFSLSLYWATQAAYTDNVPTLREAIGMMEHASELIAEAAIVGLPCP